MGKFAVKTGNDEQFYFNLLAENGQVVLSSEGYTSKAACLNGIESVKANSQDDSKYEKLTASNGKYYFTLKAGNGQVIGKSQMYESPSGVSTGIASVKANAAGATMEEA